MPYARFLLSPLLSSAVPLPAVRGGYLCNDFTTIQGNSRANGECAFAMIAPSGGIFGIHSLVIPSKLFAPVPIGGFDRFTVRPDRSKPQLRASHAVTIIL